MSLSHIHIHILKAQLSLCIRTVSQYSMIFAYTKYKMSHREKKITLLYANNLNANNKEAYQPAHACTLLSAFVFRSLENIAVNPFEPNETSNLNQLEQSISVLRDVGWYFYFFIFVQILIDHSASKQWRP